MSIRPSHVSCDIPGIHGSPGNFRVTGEHSITTLTQMLCVELQQQTHWAAELQAAECSLVMYLVYLWDVSNDTIHGLTNTSKSVKIPAEDTSCLPII